MDVLLRFVSNEFSIDEWSDVAVLEAVELANRLADADWKELRERWQSFPKRTQIRVADVCGDTRSASPDIVPMLLAMLRSESDELREVSLDSLRCIFETHPARIDHREISSALRDFEPQDHVVATILRDFQRRLASG